MKPFLSSTLAACAANGLQEITSLGSAPLNVKQIAGTVSLNRADAEQLRVTMLDFNGYPRGVAGSARALSLPPDVIYYLIETP